jgi:hypothetical protein
LKLNTEDKIKELFAEKLGGHESPVNSELWNAITSQVGTSVAATSTGLSVVAKAIIGISAASVIGVGAYFITQNDSASTNQAQKENVHLVANDTEEQVNVVEGTTVQHETTTNKNAIVTEVNNVGKGAPVATEDNHHNQEVKLPVSSEENLKAKQKDTSPAAATHNAGSAEGKSATVRENESKSPVKSVGDKQAERLTESPSTKPEPVKATFEVTKLPNVYVLNANGYFSIGYQGEYQDFQFTVMDKMNNVIYRSNQPDFEWRGTDLGGNTIEPGNYIYIITAKDKAGKPINKYSPLTVINQ